MNDINQEERHMAYEYDRFQREESGGSFLMGLLAGTVLGAGLGLLFAPKSGSELRSQIGSQIADQTGKLREVADPYYQQATEKVQQATEKVTQIVDKGREAYDRARSSVSNMAATGTTGATTPAAGPTGATVGSTGTTRGA
jgi:gas vesicle protein